MNTQSDLTDFQIQPIVDIASNRVCGGEVLWRPGGEPMTQDLFEELQENPLLNTEVAIGSFVFALSSLTKFQSDVWLSVNLGTKYLGNGSSFFKSLSRKIPDLDLTRKKAGKRLVIELSECDIATENGLVFIEKLSSDHSLAIDDFGAGNAPLNHMLRVDFDKVKVDRSIVSGCDSDSRKQRFLNWLVGGCHSIGVSLCAEGVETESELAYLRRINVDMGQGYLWSKAISSEKFEDLAVPLQSAAKSLGQLMNT